MASTPSALAQIAPANLHTEHTHHHEKDELTGTYSVTSAEYTQLRGIDFRGTTVITNVLTDVDVTLEERPISDEQLAVNGWPGYNVLGALVNDDARITNLGGSFTATNYTAGFAKGIVAYEAYIDNITATVTATVDNTYAVNSAYGLELYGTSIGNINSTISASSSSSSSYAIFANSGTTITGTIAGNMITHSNGSNAAGVYAKESTLNDISATITTTSDTLTGVQATPRIHGIELIDSSAGNITSKIQVDTKSGGTYGIKLQSLDSAYTTRVESINSDIDISTGSSYAAGIHVGAGTSVGTIAGDIYISGEEASLNGAAIESGKVTAIDGLKVTLESTAGAVTGIRLGQNADDSGEPDTTRVESINADVTVSTNDSKAAIGLRVADASLVDSISGSYKSINTGDAQSTGGFSVGYIAGESFSEINNSITILNEATGNSEGLNIDWANTSLGVSRVHGDSTAIQLSNGASIDKPFGKSITAHSTNGNATALSYDHDQVITLQSTAELKATQGENGAEMATAIKNTVNGIKLEAEGGTAGSQATLSGNVNAGTQDLSFMLGGFSVKSETWTSSALNMGAATTTAHVLVEQSTISTAAVYNFYVESMSDFSQLTIAAGHTFGMDDLVQFNIYLSDSFFNGLEEGQIAIIDGSTNAVEGNYTYTIHGNQDDRAVYSFDANGHYITVLPNDAIIPEPTTTTLSLLALAGLLARRRRQRA